MAKNLYKYVGVEKLANLAAAKENTDVFTFSSGTATPPSGYEDITDDVLAFNPSLPNSTSDRTPVNSENTINAEGRGNAEARLSIFNDNVTTPQLFASGKGYYAIAAELANGETTVFVGTLNNTDKQSPEPENGRQITEYTFSNSKKADTVWTAPPA